MIHPLGSPWFQHAMDDEPNLQEKGRRTNHKAKLLKTIVQKTWN
mgnify:CR=1 FL=1